MIQFLNRFLRDQRGATAIEYGLIAGLIAVAILAAVTDIGGYLKVIFQKIAASLQTPGTP